ncbi:MAG TPA: penicillin-binding transpeptidase domain-containing protein, partial [Patescibacteria group bacterium]|nr:penicillin-binding transpeptidase domain-containing protein [Patescibacteria group bacterium]
ISDQQGNIIKTMEPIIQNPQVVSKDTINIVQRGMREAVLSLSGSARSLQQLRVSSAAKTGTAQFGKKDVTHSWFTVFAPYENPVIALTILVEEGGEGNEAALLVAWDTLQQYFK